MTIKRILAALLILLLCTACANQKLPASEEQMEKPKETFAYIENEDANNRFPRLSARDLVQVGQYLFGTGVFGQNLILQCYDLSCKTAEVACSKPDCTHDNEECNAYYYRDCGSLSLYHDQLYWLGVEGEGAEKMDTLAIRRMDPFAGTRESVRSVSWNEIMVRYGPQHMRVHRGTAYLECMKRTIVESSPHPKHKLSLLAMPLSEEGETKVIFERDYDCGAQMQTRYCGNYIYLFCSLWTREPAATWYEIYKVDIQSGECKAEITKLEPDCYFDDFWVDNDYRLLAAGRDKNDSTKSFVWQIEDGTVKELFSFEDISGNLGSYLLDHIAVDLRHVNGEYPCCICNFDGRVLYDGNLTLPTQIPDLYPDNCKIESIHIVGGDENVPIVLYKVSGKGMSDNVLLMYDLKNNMEPSAIWNEPWKSIFTAVAEITDIIAVTALRHILIDEGSAIGN